MKIDYKNISNKKIADILLVTATATETEMLHEAMLPVCTEGLLEIEYDGRVYFAGMLGGYNVIHCQCMSMGTQEQGSSTLTTSAALRAWPCVKAVVMIGIAFGMYENEIDNPQHFSDVLIASKVFPYENQRLNGDGSIDYRGVEHLTEQHFIDAFAVITRKWERKNVSGDTTKIEICPLLSGEKLVDDITKRDQLKLNFKDYRGGEMEGIGVAAACEEYRKPWILLKAICDFADGNKGSDKKTKQIDAAKASVMACVLAFETANVATLIGKKTNYWYRPLELDLSKVFFVHYDNDCASYYLERNVDAELHPYIMTKSCWVYGRAGMGKSELLTRTLICNSVEYIYVDLSLCSKTNVEDVFSVIYSTLCEKVEVNQDSNLDFNAYVKAICKILNTFSSSKKIYLLIDEIPFDHNNAVFSDFVDKFCSMMNYCSRSINEKSIFFMLSSIVSPIDALEDDYKSKISQYIKFVELKIWTTEECVQLVKLLTKTVTLEFEGIEIEDFVEKFKHSPRLIKNALKESCSLGYKKIDDIIINRIIVG